MNDMMAALWTEKYRPQTVSDVILPAHMKKVFTEMVKTKDIQNMLFCGGPGMGKTTVAKAICKELNLDYIVINGSKDGNIDTLRGKIQQFASTISLEGGIKVIILDEADYLNAQSTQPALRGFIEEFSGNCRFILTANYRNKILPPLQSRCSVYDFSIKTKEKPQLYGSFLKRLEFILNEENISYTQKALAELIKKHAPDYRRILNEAQRYSKSGTIDEGVLTNLTDESMKSLMGFLKDKDFRKMRKWVVDNLDIESAAIYRGIYDQIGENLKPHSIPPVILLLAEYQYKQAFVADHEINIVAALTEIMSEADWK